MEEAGQIHLPTLSNSTLHLLLPQESRAGGLGEAAPRSRRPETQERWRTDMEKQGASNQQGDIPGKWLGKATL